MKWIDVTEQLPDSDVQVLIADADGSVSVAAMDDDWDCFVDEYGTHYDDSDGYKITHWMPFPEPPPKEDA